MPDQPLALSFRAISNGRELRFGLRLDDDAATRLAVPPSRVRAHAPKHHSSPPAEPDPALNALRRGW